MCLWTCQYIGGFLLEDICSVITALVVFEFLEIIAQDLEITHNGASHVEISNVNMGIRIMDINSNILLWVKIKFFYPHVLISLPVFWVHCCSLVTTTALGHVC